MENSKIFIIALSLALIFTLINFLYSKYKRARRAVLGIVNDVKMASRAVEQLSEFLESDEPLPKSVSGATDIYLRQIERDFPDFHLNEMERAVAIFMDEFLSIRYALLKDFAESNANKYITDSIEGEPGINYSKFKINKVAICGYRKTDTYATIELQVSVGHNANEKRLEERYALEYTLRIKDEEISTKAFTCPNCGAQLTTADKLVCPYCDVKIARDTFLSWQFTKSEKL